MSKYHKGDKFIVEIKEVINSDNGTLYRSDFKTLTFDDNGLDKLQKYKQPTISEDTLEMERIKALNEGRNEMWEWIKKLWDLGTRNCNNIFKYPLVSDIIENYTPQEVIAKLEVYEKEQEIKVGDVLKAKVDGTKCVVSSDKVDNGYVLTFPDGSGSARDLTYIEKHYVKTGKHIDIQNMLNQIKE